MNHSTASGNAPGRFLFWGGGGEPPQCAAGEGPCPPAPSRGEARSSPRSAAACSACIVRRDGQNRGARRPPAPSRGGARSSPRSAHQNGHFPSSWKMSGMPRAVGRNRAKHLPPNQPSLGPGGAGTGKFCAGWPRPCPPPHAAFRTRCTRTVQRVRSEAHYAAAVLRLARPASGGGPCKKGERAALFLLCPRRRPLAPSAALC